jgi:hypothetical protein
VFKEIGKFSYSWIVVGKYCPFFVSVFFFVSIDFAILSVSCIGMLTYRSFIYVFIYFLLALQPIVGLYFAAL